MAQVLAESGIELGTAKNERRTVSTVCVLQTVWNSAAYASPDSETVLPHSQRTSPPMKCLGASENSRTV